MDENDAIKSLIQPLLDAQSLLVENDGTNIKEVEGLIRNRDIALDNLEAAIDGKTPTKPKAEVRQTLDELDPIVASKEETVTKSSGSVFKDLNVPEPKAKAKKK